MLFIGRDVLGRRSLVMSTTPDYSCLVISSVLPQSESLLQSEELLPPGIFSMRFHDVESPGFGSLSLRRYSWPSLDSSCCKVPSIFERFFKNMSMETVDNILFCDQTVEMLPTEEEDNRLKRLASLVPSEKDLDVDFALMTLLFEQSLNEFPDLETLIAGFIKVLLSSIEIRCRAIPDRCLSCSSESICSHCKVGVLFSGGIDSTIIAALVDEALPAEEAYAVELLNVAFHQNNERSKGPVPPDRQTALAVVSLLNQENEARKFELACVNVSQAELHETRKSRIKELILPCDTILDDSLGRSQQRLIQY